MPSVHAGNALVTVIETGISAASTLGLGSCANGAIQMHHFESLLSKRGRW